MMINLKISNPDQSVVELEKELANEIGSEQITVIKGNGFTGLEELNYVLSIGGGIVISKVAGIISSYMAKNKDKSIKIGNKEIKGFNADEVIEILKEMKR